MKNERKVLCRKVLIHPVTFDSNPPNLVLSSLKDSMSSLPGAPHWLGWSQGLWEDCPTPSSPPGPSCPDRRGRRPPDTGVCGPPGFTVWISKQLKNIFATKYLIPNSLRCLENPLVVGHVSVSADIWWLTNKEDIFCPVSTICQRTPSLRHLTDCS